MRAPLSVFWTPNYNFSCSTKLSTKFPLLIKAKVLTNKEVSCLKTLKCYICHANKFVGILTFMSLINFILSCLEHAKCFITAGPVVLSTECYAFF